MIVSSLTESVQIILVWTNHLYVSFLSYLTSLLPKCSSAARKLAHGLSQRIYVLKRTAKSVLDASWECQYIATEGNHWNSEITYTAANGFAIGLVLILLRFKYLILPRRNQRSPLINISNKQNNNQHLLIGAQRQKIIKQVEYTTRNKKIIIFDLLCKTLTKVEFIIKKWK